MPAYEFTTEEEEFTTEDTEDTEKKEKKEKKEKREKKGRGIKDERGVGDIAGLMRD